MRVELDERPRCDHQVRGREFLFRFLFPRGLRRVLKNRDLRIVFQSFEQRPLHDFQLHFKAHPALPGVERHHVVQKAFEVNIPEKLVARDPAEDLFDRGFRIARFLNGFLEIVPSISRDAAIFDQLFPTPYEKDRDAVAIQPLKAVDDGVLHALFLQGLQPPAR